MDNFQSMSTNTNVITCCFADTNYNEVNNHTIIPRKKALFKPSTILIHTIHKGLWVTFDNKQDNVQDQ